jgi:hypothetical protein
VHLGDELRALLALGEHLGVQRCERGGERSGPRRAQQRVQRLAALGVVDDGAVEQLAYA